MELVENIDYINKRLISEFGLEFNGQPRWRVVFSDDQYEKRWTEFTDEGFQLLCPEVRLLPKYKHYLKGVYILERLVPVSKPTDLVEKISYEAAWVFLDHNRNYLPPFFDGCKFVIESVYSAISKKGNHVKYKDVKMSSEEKELELIKIQNKLFGNETSTTDSLHYKEGVVNPYDSKTASKTELELAKQMEIPNGS